MMARAELAAGGRLPGAADAPSAALFKFGTEDRIQCGETGRVRNLRWNHTLNRGECRACRARRSPQETCTG